MAEPVDIMEITRQAWDDATTALAQIADEITQSAHSPAIKAAGEGSQAHEKAKRLAYIRVLSSAWYVAELAMATAHRSGIFTDQQLGAMVMEARSFCVNATRGAKVMCKAAPCTWHGLLVEVGPTMECPQCKAQTVFAPQIMVPEQAPVQVAPPQNGHNLRIIR